MLMNLILVCAKLDGRFMRWSHGRFVQVGPVLDGERVVRGPSPLLLNAECMINADYVRKCSGHLRSYHGDIHIRYTHIGFPGWFGHCIGHTSIHIMFAKHWIPFRPAHQGCSQLTTLRNQTLICQDTTTKLSKFRFNPNSSQKSSTFFLAKNQFWSASNARNQRKVNARSLGQTLGGQKQRRGAALCSWALGAATRRKGDLDDSWVNYSNSLTWIVRP